VALAVSERGDAVASALPRLGRRVAPAIVLGALVVLFAAGPERTHVARAAGSGAIASQPAHTVAYDHYSLTIDGRRVYVWSGEFHYWRLPSPDLWRDVLQKMKAAGFNAVSIYFDWAYHSPAPGVYDFTGIRDVDRLLDIASDVGIYVIARPGPYINAETDSGGFPGWLTAQKGRARSSASDFQAASDEWLHHIDPIIARHQLTNGTGTVILYQVENEYGSNTDPQYMVNTEQVIRDDGITVPLTHNHCCGSATWATGPGAVDIPGQDSYPQGFNCSNPTQWAGVGGLPRYRDDAPIFTPEFQGGSFDPWGGPGYDKCRQLTGADFERVFYTNNVAVGATLQSLYMTYGGTSWGWIPDPSQVYTSYDYGAPISEQRGLGAKYDEVHRLGYFFGAVASLTKTAQAAVSAPSNRAIVETARVNPDDHTQVLVLRHANSTSTSNDTTHISVDLAARSTYTYDDRDPALVYTGAWTHAGPEQSYTSADYLRTESFSNTTGDSVSVTFTGTAVRWISSYDGNHGIADVYLDGTKVATVDGYGASKATQQVFYAADNLADTTHTLRIVVTGQQNPSASGRFVVVDAIDVPPPGANFYPSVPQQPGTAIRFNGRDAKMLLANSTLGSERLVYSTSELLTDAAIGGSDVAVLYGRPGEDGETVLRYDEQPTVSGDVASVWDAARHDLRLNYTHGAQTRVQIDGTVDGAQRRLVLFIGTDDDAARWWREETSAGTVLVHGPLLVRTGSASGSTLSLTGDTDAATTLDVVAPAAIAGVIWNGHGVTIQQTADGTLRGALAGPQPVTLPALTQWKYRFETPEAQPAFDDSAWTVADKLSTSNPTEPGTLPVLYADEYGFHHGDVWYRGDFTATGGETAVSLRAITGRAGVYAAWLNGEYLGSSGSGPHTFAIPAGTLDPGADNVLAVLVENMGHNEDFNANDSHKEPRGLTSAALAGASPTVTWRIQGNRGGETLVDPVRGPLNAGGGYGQRNGWSLPRFDDGSWQTVTLPHSEPTPGVAWYRTTVPLDLPRGQDTAIGLRITDDPARHYRAQIYVNGWLLGRYVNDVGPQHVFSLPTGILRANGTNTIAIAAWGTDSSGGLGTVELVSYYSVAGGVTVSNVDSPAYDRERDAEKVAGTRLHVTAPDRVDAGTPVTVSATLSVPDDQPAISGIALSLAVPDGWSAEPTTPTTFGKLAPGGAVTASWTVTPPSGELPAFSFVTATATYVQRGKSASISDTRAMATPPPPPPPPHGTVYVSDLPFVTATNGWGPVERDMSNGEDAAGDGHTISIRTTTFAKGLGVHPSGEVDVYLGGNCTIFTATVGIDNEVIPDVQSRGHGGTSQFHVLADGVERYASPLQTIATAPTPVSVNVSGAQFLQLVISDGGDGNELDHSDWGGAQLTCGS
jgi:beta-galactosidase GanA